MLAVQIVVLGKSLGGAVALHLASSNPDSFKAIVVENTFLSIEDVAPKVSHCNQQATHRCMLLQGFVYTKQLQGLLHSSRPLYCLRDPVSRHCFLCVAWLPQQHHRVSSVLQMLPFLGPVLGRGKVGNFLIRNKWRSYNAIRKLQHIPMLMLSAGQVHTQQACRSRSHAALVSYAAISTHPLICRYGQLCMIAYVGVLRHT